LPIKLSLTFLIVKVIKTRNKNIRIKDIAQKAGVSIGTVDRVIHSRGEVSQSTRDNVLRIIKELDYTPNILASTLASRKVNVFATLLPKAPTRDAYWSRPLEGISNSVSALQQYGVEVKHYFFDMEDTSTFTQEAGKLLEIEPDGVLLAPWAHREASGFVKDLDNKGIPYVFIDSNITEAHPVSFIGQDAFQSGYLSAKLIDFGLGKDAVILVVHISKELDNQNHLLQREKGFYSFFSEKGRKDRKILKVELDSNGKDLEPELMKKGISVSEIDGVFVTNSKVHKAASYFSAQQESPRIIGYDLIPENIKHMKSGNIDFLISQKPEKQGYSAINALFDHVVLKKGVKQENYTNIDIITKENFEYYSSL